MNVDLAALALKAQQGAYAPYSRFPVGAALLCRDGRTFVGCNVENASYPLSVCAERNAIAAAVVAGARDFVAVAICTDTAPPSPPCGGCRQVLSEFCPPAMPVYFAGRDGVPRATTIGELIPMDSLHSLKNGVS